MAEVQGQKKSEKGQSPFQKAEVLSWHDNGGTLTSLMYVFMFYYYI